MKPGRFLRRSIAARAERMALWTRKSHWWFWLGGVGLTLILTACASQPLTVTYQPVEVRVVAADTCGPLMDELAVAYQQEYPWVTVRVDVLDAAVAEEWLREGRADLAVLTWVGEEPSPLWTMPFAGDAIAVIVHPAVPVTAISTTELREILRGRLSEWADGTPVQVVSREEGAGLRTLFERAVLPGASLTLAALVAPDNAVVVETVSTTPGAIGYVSAAWLVDSVRPLTVDGLSPAQVVREGGALHYTLYLAAVAEPAGDVQAFTQWLLGPQAQQVVARHFGPRP